MRADRKHNKTSYGAFAKTTQQPAIQTQLDTDRHATATPLCGPTRYDLHLRDGTERKRRTRAKTKRAGQRGNEEDRRGSCLFAPNWLVSPLCWILTGCACCLDPSACFPMAGEEGWHTKPGEGGKGLRVLRGVGGKGGEGWLRVINILDSQMITQCHS